MSLTAHGKLADATFPQALENPPGFPQTHSLGDEISTLTSYRGTDAGPVAITASARKILNILFGWARSGRAFDPARVFVCQSQIARAA